MTENYFGELQMMEEVAEHDTPDSSYVAQPAVGFLFPWEEAGSAKNPITIDKDEGFAETLTPPAPRQPRPALRSIENL